MAVQYEKETGDLVINGFEQGIAISPHLGIANIQNGNISTESGEVLASYNRVKQDQTAVPSGTLTASGGAGNFYLATNPALQVGTWITIGSSSITSLPGGTYYVSYKNNGLIQLSAHYDPGGANAISHDTSGTATFNTFRDMGSPIAYCIEKFNNTNGAQYRYYILDANALVWVYDTAVYTSSLFVSGTATTWFLPDFSINYFGGTTAPSGIAVLNGWLHAFAGNNIWVKSTSNLGGTTSNTSTWVAITNAIMMSQSNTTNPHFAYVGHQGKLYYTDGTYLGSIFPDTSLLTGVANVQSYASYTAVTSTGTISTLIGGSIPSTGNNVGTTGFARIPAVFFTDQAGVQPTNLSVNTIYYIAYSTANGNFQVYAAASGGSAIDIASGASGNQYFNTYFPIGTHAGAYGDTSTVTFTPQRLNLPYFEVATCMVEIGNTVIVGGIGDVLYPWNQIDPTPSDLIELPERNTVWLLNVNNMAYAGVGNKGNIYITNGSVASMAVTVPDYCAGVPGTQSTYIEPYFTWPSAYCAAYIRGRVYFSILDQTTTKAGNCGGVWSFVPTQNFYVGQNVGTALRLENKSSYGTYSGTVPVIIPNQTQVGNSPLYWSGWYSSVSGPTYGIDYTGTFASGDTVIELDLVATGTILGEQKQTFINVEYKLAAPLVSGESVAMNYRLNATDAWTTCGAVQVESTTALSGYFAPLPFEKTQWIQLQLVLTANGSTTASYVRLTEVRLRRLT